MSLTYTVIARERLTPTASTPFTSTNIPGTQSRTAFVRIQALKGDIWIRTDGSDATAATGLKIPENSHGEIWPPKLENFRCIDDGDNAELECVYMGRVN